MSRILDNGDAKINKTQPMICRGGRSLPSTIIIAATEAAAGSGGRARRE